MNEWEQRWQSGQAGWDRGSSPPILKELVATGALPRGRALVPGCGAGYDVLALAAPDRRVLGLDIAPTARERFLALREQRNVPEERAEVRLEDFFDWEPGEPFDLVWDYTFLCAIEPGRREAWARRMTGLIRPGGELVTLLYPVLRPQDEVPPGPPYPLTMAGIEELLGDAFERTATERVTASHPGREGKEWLVRWQRTADTG